jgi:anti-anti-sigma factor
MNQGRSSAPSRVAVFPGKVPRDKAVNSHRGPHPERIEDSACRSHTAMTQSGNQATADRGDGIQILPTPEELDLATADGLVEQGCAAISRHAWMLLLDLTGLSFCDARGLSAFVRIANHADNAGCRFGLIAPQAPVARILRLTGLDGRIPVFTTIGNALTRLAAMPRAPMFVSVHTRLGTKPIGLSIRLDPQSEHLFSMQMIDPPLVGQRVNMGGRSGGKTQLGTAWPG